MSPSKELNIITGETGAGKSIMLGAIGLLLGNRADTKVLFNQEEKCVIEGTFDISDYDLKNFYFEAELDYDKECIIRREISSTGKSRAFINDTPVNLEVLKKWGNSLVDIHSQHETLLLGNSNFQISILDAYSNHLSSVEEYRTLYKEYKSQEAAYDELLAESAEAKKQSDYNSYLLNELLDASLQSGEQEKKEEDLKLLENAENIKVKLNQVYTILSGSESDILSSLKLAEKSLDQISGLSKNYEDLKSRIAAALIELKDITAELEDEESKVEFSPEAIEIIQERLSRIYTLQTKHQKKTVEELLEIQLELEKKVAKVLNLDDEIAKAKSILQNTYKALISKAKQLSEARRKSGLPIKKELENLLKEVGMPDATVQINIQDTDPNIYGIDAVSLLFSANKGVTPQELKNAASGGEFSRLMLCIKYILAGKTSLPTIIFDEIDTGISGEIAIKVGKMIKQMSKKHQVVSITHLPQMASQGNSHYFVYKDNSSDRTVSKIKKLSDEERIMEIAQMIGGQKPSETAVNSAKELLEMK